MKKWISLLLAIVMLFSCVPMYAGATEEDTGMIVTEPAETDYIFVMIVK